MPLNLINIFISAIMEQLKQQLAAMSRRLESLALAPNPSRGKTARNRRRRQRQRANRSAGQSTPGTTGVTTGVSMGGGRRRRRGNVSVQAGEIVLARQELIRAVTIKSGASEVKDYIDLNPAQFTFLKSLYSSFERIKFLKLNVYYKSAVGTTQGGMVTYAIDWTVSASGKSRTDLSSYTPNMSHPVWETPRQPLTLPVSRLQSRQWYVNNSSADVIDTTPARLLVAANASAVSADLIVGELWVDYHVILSGTKA